VNDKKFMKEIYFIKGYKKKKLIQSIKGKHTSIEITEIKSKRTEQIKK
jgi:hypothetical protein